MPTFTAKSPTYHEHATALRQRYPVAYSPVAPHRRRCRHYDRNRTHRTITVDAYLWDLALVAKARRNAKGGTMCTNLSSLCEDALRSWLISDGGVREEWLTGRLPDDWAEDVAKLERKREGRGTGPKRQKKPKGIPAEVLPGFRSSEGDAAWFFALRSWLDLRNLELMDIKAGRVIVRLGPNGVPFFLDTQSRYSGFPRRSTFL